MRGWKKRLLCTMLAGVTVLSGCSAGGSGASGSSAGESSGEQTTAEAAQDIVVWTGQRADAAYRRITPLRWNWPLPANRRRISFRW